MRSTILRDRASRVSAMGLALFVCVGVCGASGVTACNVITGANELTVSAGVGGAGGDPSSTASHGPSSTATTTAGSGGATTGTTTAASSGGPVTAEQLCVDTINMFRATRSLPPYQRWQSNESCVDQEATTDGMMMSPHYSFIHSHMCNSSGENECPGWSKNPLDPGQGIAGCLAMMWDEKNQPGCAGCDTCDFPYQNCTNCTSNGATVCGHYLNMKSSVLTEVACGFWSGGWYTQDFQ